MKKWNNYSSKKKRAVYLWGVVDDKSARDVVSKLLLLDADKPGRK